MSLNQILNPVGELDVKFNSLTCSSTSTKSTFPAGITASDSNFTHISCSSPTTTSNFPAGITAGPSDFTGIMNLQAGDLVLDSTGNITANQVLSKYQVNKEAPIITSGLTLTASQFINGSVYFMGGVSGNITCPSSGSIDAELGINTDGYVISLNVSNGRQVQDVSIVPPNGASRLLQVAHALGNPYDTTFWFTRVAAEWVFIGN